MMMMSYRDSLVNMIGSIVFYVKIVFCHSNAWMQEVIHISNSGSIVTYLSEGYSQNNFLV